MVAGAGDGENGVGQLRGDGDLLPGCAVVGGVEECASGVAGPDVALCGGEGEDAGFADGDPSLAAVFGTAEGAAGPGLDGPETAGFDEHVSSDGSAHGALRNEA